MMALIVSVPAQSEFNFDQPDFFMEFDTPTYSIVTIDYTETIGNMQTMWSGFDEVGTVSWGGCMNLGTAEFYNFSYDTYDIYKTTIGNTNFYELPANTTPRQNEGLFRLDIGEY